MKRSLINWLGLLGLVSLISYTVAVVFSPFAYPGYNWISQAVSDLSATNAPSLELWNQLSSLYGLCGIVCVMMVCVAVQGHLNKPTRMGLYLFAVMNWVSVVGYTIFPLSASGYAGTFQDMMHVYVVTVLVVLLSLISLVLIMIGGYCKKRSVSFALWAIIAFVMMFVGAIGVAVASEAYFGVFERISIFAPITFNAVLGFYLFNDKFKKMP